jgi:hypothetical protein
MTIHLLVLQNLLHTCLNSTTGKYALTWEELITLRWFLYESDKGELARLELLKQAGTLGIEPAELLAVKWLAEQLIMRKNFVD